MNKRAYLLIGTILFANGWPVFGEVSSASTGKKIVSFELKDSDGRNWHLDGLADAELVVVAFLGTECPIVKLSILELGALQSRFAKRVSFVGIDSNRQDSIAEIQHFVRSQKIRFPVLRDTGNRIADQFGATRTPEVFLLNSDRRVIYQGRIDDRYSYGVQRKQAVNQYLADAVESALAGKEVETPYTAPIGCLIGRRRVPQDAARVTYANQISRILQAHCIKCHRRGEIAPFALTEYEEVAGWAEMIDEVVRDQRMPPWHADARPGQFKNDLRLSAEEKQLLHEWAEAGAPEGDPQHLPESPPQLVEGWQIGEPDRVFTMAEQPFEVPATGVVPYQYFVVESGFTEDKWVKAAECRPGNRAVVHHIIVGVAGEGEFGRGGVHSDLQSEWIAATAPGAPPTIFPSGYAKLIPAGSKLVFQMHYTPNGTSQTDLSRIGLIFEEPEQVKHRVLTLMAYNDRFRIPAGASNHKVVARYQLDRPMELLSMFPHMHYRGRSFTYDFRFPDGTIETLLSVPHYDFNWQNAYALSHSRDLPAGTELTCTAYFDNSGQNLANPDPTKAVTWGDQTWEEMMIGYFNVALPRD